MGEYFKPEELKTEEELEAEKKAIAEPEQKQKSKPAETDLIDYEGLDVDAKLNYNLDQILNIIKGLPDAEVQDQAVHQIVKTLIINGTSEGNFNRALGSLEITKQLIINNFFEEESNNIES